MHVSNTDPHDPLQVGESNVNVTKKRHILTLEQKMTVLEHLDKGLTHQDIATMFHVSRQMIGYINNNRAKFKHQYDVVRVKHPKVLSKRYSSAEDSVLENILFGWYLQNREACIPIGGNLLKEKALIINTNLNGNPNFVASAGWLSRFKQRHDIRQLSAEKWSADTEASEEFSREFRAFIESEGFDKSHIYNADETGLHWKELPRNTLASTNETNVDGFEMTQNRVTLMTCSNASGTHKIPVMVIGQYKEPWCLQGVNTLPLVYTHQQNSLMDLTVLRHWYTTVFLPAIKEKMCNKNEKCLLLLDSAPCHPNVEALNAIDPCCVVKYLPPNTMSLIQPMYHGVINTLKRHYRRIFLRELLLEAEGPDKYDRFLKKWDLLYCIRTVASAWDAVQQETLVNAWSNLLDNGPRDIFQYEIDDEEICHLASSAMQMPLSLEEVVTWVDSDKNDWGWKIQSLEEIANRVTGTISEVVINEEIKEDVKEEKEVEAENVPRELGTDTTNEVSEMEAYRGIDNMYKWLQKRSDVTAEELLSAARLRKKIVDVIAANKISSSS